MLSLASVMLVLLPILTTSANPAATATRTSMCWLLRLCNRYDIPNHMAFLNLDSARATLYVSEEEATEVQHAVNA